jgi:hypothetical protein
MTQQDYTHSITPPPELRSKWFNEAPGADLYDYIIEQAAQWGADQELEACCTELYKRNNSFVSRELRDARRPKPPSLKKQALDEVVAAVAGGNIMPERGATIRLALEQLPDNQ